MKKYIADVLTALRLVAAVTLIIMTFVHAAPEWALLVFALGELTDALDGIAARRWPFLDGEIPVYRKYAVTYDKITDIALMLSTALYVLILCNSRMLYIIAGLSIIDCCAIDFLTYGKLFGSPNNYNPKFFWGTDRPIAERVLLLRRYFYLILIAAMICILLTEAAISSLLKTILFILAAIIACIFFIVKKDRRTEV